MERGAVKIFSRPSVLRGRRRGTATFELIRLPALAAALAAGWFFFWPAGAAPGNAAAAEKTAVLSGWEKADLESKKGERAYRKEYYKSAERHFREALRHVPRKLHALSGLGWTLYDSDRRDEAFSVFKKAHERYPGDGSVRRGLAYLYYRYGRSGKARELLGSLDKEQWPELANIDDELRARRLRGTPLPKLPLEADEPDLAGDLLGFLKPGAPQKKAEENKVPESQKELFEVKPAGKPAKEKRRASLRKPESPAAPRKKVRFVFAQKPSFHTMVFVPGGAVSRKGLDERRVPPFRIDKLEVTNALYASFVQATGYPRPPFWKWRRFAGPHLPVVGITWSEARAFCRWAGKRLPTEDEWEFAASAGDQKRAYPWGRKFVGRNAVFGLRPDSGGPKAVGRRPSGASLYGVEDMAGNVWEWVEDSYRIEPGRSAPVVRGGKVYRTLRGGSWVNGRWALSVTSRTGDLPGRRLPVYGFRCAANSP